MSFQNLIESKKFNIWRYANFYPSLEPKFQLSLGEGWTGEELVEGIIFKKEFDNPTGSVKDRGMAYQMSDVYRQGLKEVVIPSSGNGAVAAAAYAKVIGVKATAFILPQAPQAKREEIKKQGAEIRFSERTVSEAAAVALELGLRNLRPSQDPAAVPGFMSLGLEIYERLVRRGQEVGEIFLAVSSGTTLVGLGRSLTKLFEGGFLSQLPQLHAVQTAAVHPIASEFDQDFRPKARSIAKAICARETARKEEALALIRQTGGSGWVVSDSEIQMAHGWLNQKDLACCPTSAAALAGLWKARGRGWGVGHPLVILTGRRYE